MPSTSRRMLTLTSDHASLFLMSPFLSQVLDDQRKAQDVVLDPKALEKVGIKNYDKHRATATLHQALATNIYKTKDGRCYHVHGKRSECGVGTGTDIG